MSFFLSLFCFLPFRKKEGLTEIEFLDIFLFLSFVVRASFGSSTMAGEGADTDSGVSPASTAQGNKTSLHPRTSHSAALSVRPSLEIPKLRNNPKRVDV